MIARHDAATDAFVEFIEAAELEAESAFDAAQTIARRMGARLVDGRCEFGIWAPELLEKRVADGDIFLEVLKPEGPLALDLARRTIRFSRHLVPMERAGSYRVVAVEGVRAGTRETVGDFYSLVWRDPDGKWTRVLDPMADSLPFGAFAPAEVYDVAGMQAAREDKAYWSSLGGSGDEPVKIGPACNILQVHIPTATSGMTLASFTREVERLAAAITHDRELEPGDRIFLGYDAVQLMPVEPTTVYETGPEFWRETPIDEERIEVDLRRVDTTNWGYDVVIAGMAAVNPALLESDRPDELVDLAAALHNFPGKPKKLIFDVVFGHSDGQGLNALNPHWFAGANMYGLNLAYKHPTVRALLLEMQRRKVDFGADGVRVDGAQDFKWFDPDTQTMRHDNEYLQSMSDVVQEVAGRRYRPWFIFEDGRPWPQEDWELASTYRAVIENQRDDDVFQWGPLSFAHNTPFIYTFFLSKWWRIREILEVGENWISGFSNHDTLRRGTQVSEKLNVNSRLGVTRMEILDKAYDNPAAHMLVYAAFPGVPMDFLNATARTSWGFIRNQDDRWGVKILAEEAISLKWQVDIHSFSKPGVFRRLKEMGFSTLEDLARFLHVLPALVDTTEYDLKTVATLLNAIDPPLAGPHPYDVVTLKKIARAWMDDMHDYCNVATYLDRLGEAQTSFTLALREFRLDRPWLRRNFRPEDRYDYQSPINGRSLFRFHRHGPDGEEVFAVILMEGAPMQDVDPLSLGFEGMGTDGWRLALATPPIGSDYWGGPLTLLDAMGVVYTRGGREG